MKHQRRWPLNQMWSSILLSVFPFEFSCKKLIGTICTDYILLANSHAHLFLSALNRPLGADGRTCSFCIRWCVTETLVSHATKEISWSVCKTGCFAKTADASNWVFKPGESAAALCTTAEISDSMHTPHSLIWVSIQPKISSVPSGTIQTECSIEHVNEQQYFMMY